MKGTVYGGILMDCDCSCGVALRDVPIPEAVKDIGKYALLKMSKLHLPSCHSPKWAGAVMFRDGGSRVAVLLNGAKR